jgi:hypothetical protein
VRLLRWFFAVDEPSTWQQLTEKLKDEPKRLRVRWAKPDARYAPMNRKPHLVKSENRRRA